jgi:hypothetical protein
MPTTEDHAVQFVKDYELRHGRMATDRRYERTYVADLESVGPDGSRRDIEIKSTATSMRGWFLGMQPRQLEQIRSNPDFYVYVVEGVASGRMTLRILGSDKLTAMIEKAVARTSYEVPWSTAEYESTDIERD